MNYKFLHKTAGMIAFATIASFLVATLLSELTGNHELIALAKTTIVYALPILFICMPFTVISGKKQAIAYPNNYWVETKSKRMKLIGINAIILLTPLALALHYFAQNNQFDVKFYSLQVFEIICGLINMLLFSKMVADGRKINRIGGKSSGRE